MKDQIILSKRFIALTLSLFIVGVVTFIAGVSIDQKTTWANYLLVNFYFLSVAMGGTFFLVIQSITQSGWSSAFKRIPEAMMSYIPVAAVFFVLIWFGIKAIYGWTGNHENNEELLSHGKSVYFSLPFFFARIIIFFGLWIIFIRKLRFLSLREDSLKTEDHDGIMLLFNKSELYSKILIFILIISFSVAAFDWLMSLDIHWYSTIFALKYIVAAFLHGVSILALIIFILNRKGYFPFLNKYHLHDLARYIFIFSIIYGYFWFAQFMIIWYGNIPEETVYYYIRWSENWKIIFYLEIGLNWSLPFIVLLPVKTSRNMFAIIVVIIGLIAGQYLDLFLHIMPGIMESFQIGWIEAGLFIGYAGLFAFIIGLTLSRANLIPKNHPYLEESLKHSFN